MVTSCFLFVFLGWLTLCSCDCNFLYHNGARTPSNTNLWNKIKGKRYSCFDEPKEQYSYNVGICTSAEQTPGSDSAGAVQTDKAGQHRHNLGRYTKADFVEGYDWLMLQYYDGQPYGSHCSGSNRTTIIMVECMPTIENGQLALVEEARNKTTNCYYLFELKIAAACRPASTGLSVGSIICIVFLCLVAVYLIFGFLYQRFIKGAQGYEQVPNYSSWRELGNLSSDGCSFVFKTDSLSESRQYRGIGGTDIPASEEIPRDTDRDDQLLNM